MPTKGRSTLDPLAPDRDDRGVIEKVVVPLDGSSLSASALGPGGSLADAMNASLLLMTTRWDDEVGGAREYLEKQAAALGIDRVKTAIVHYRFAPEAILVAGRDPGTVVCMATHGRGGLGRPVLLVGPSVDRGAWQSAHWFAHGNLLVPLDGSKTAEAMVPIAADWAAMLDLRSWVVQVLPAPEGAVPGRDTESAYVRAQAKRMDHRGSEAQWEVLHATNVADALVMHAGRLPASLVAMSTHGRTGLARVVLGSVALRVVHESPCPCS